MTLRILPMSVAEAAHGAVPIEDAGLGAIHTERGNLPLDQLRVRADIVGLTSQTELVQEFRNPYDEPIEAVYLFPLPDRAAVTAMRMTAADRVVEADLRERQAARRAYDTAIAAGRRASIAEEDRPDVFTLRIGNLLPGERISVALTLVGVLALADGEATFRFPLVVAPRYIPGGDLPDTAAEDGAGSDTDAVLDASGGIPPVLLPGFPDPVRLGIDVGIDPGGLRLGPVRSSLHAVTTQDGRISVRPGERANRDFVLRLSLDAPADAAGLTIVPDGDGEEGTYQLIVMPPGATEPQRARDVVLLLDRSGSMKGWKMVAARRAAAQIVDTLTDVDRFAVLAFDDTIEAPERLPVGLVAASDHHRYRAVEHLARMDARGGTELLAPLRAAAALLTEQDGRDLVTVLVTDGQVGNEEQILAGSADLSRVRIHTVGIDQAVNAGFLGRLAGLGGGRCELVESEDRLAEAMDRIHRRIAAPLATGLTVTASGLPLLPGTQAPARLPDLFPGVPYVVRGRYAGTVEAGSMRVRGRTPNGAEWSATASPETAGTAALTAAWARAALRDLEDEYAAEARGPKHSRRSKLRQRIVEISLRFGVLCRFTAFVAVDPRVVTEGDHPRAVEQPVEPPSGWAMPASVIGVPTPMAAPMAAMTTNLKRRVPPVKTGLPPASGREDLSGLRQQAALEARRLRAAETEPWYRRRDTLADLGSRLAAMVGSGGTGTAPLLALAALLAEDRLAAETIDAAEIDRLWQEALRVLDAFAEGPGGLWAAGRAAGLRAFWKR
ncbi:MAG: VWA domain-containing protein [Dactylosporangium sp.]|nr:VWA domain-containing protein [Dactylosporangium sp.]NNJ60116.1 VWA domain-containing protein [Dactylosporangium sp.]